MTNPFNYTGPWPNEHTVTEADKAEWSRMAQVAYNAGKNEMGHRYSVAASIPRDWPMTEDNYRHLQDDYRTWLMHGEWRA